MAKSLRWLMVAGLILAASFGSAARADIDNASATNVQDGDNSTESNQSGRAGSGDAVAGQVAGVVSSGDASVDATNHSEDVDIETGDADGVNTASSFTGLTAGSDTLVASDLISLSATNLQDGDNDSSVTQAAEASSGDGVGGSVIGVVTSAGGSADVVAANTSEDVDIDTGDSDAENDAAAFVGLNATGTVATLADILNASATNVQEGDNDKSATQAAEAGSGDAVAGQVAGVVTSAGGSADLVLANSSVDADGESGDSEFDNVDTSFTGLNASGVITVF